MRTLGHRKRRQTQAKEMMTMPRDNAYAELAEQIGLLDAKIGRELDDHDERIRELEKQVIDLEIKLGDAEDELAEEEAA